MNEVSKIKTLDSLFEYLIAAYESSEETIMYEYSTDIGEDLEELNNKVKKLKAIYSNTKHSLSTDICSSCGATEYDKCYCEEN